MRRASIIGFLTLVLTVLAPSAGWADACCATEGPRSDCLIKAEGRAYLSTCDDCCLSSNEMGPSSSPRLVHGSWDPPLLAYPTTVRPTIKVRLVAWSDFPAFLGRAKPARSQGWSSLLFALPPPA